MKTLRIKDRTPQGSLSFDLVDILAECGDYIARRWVLWNVYWNARYDYPDSELERLYAECYQRLEEAPNRQLQMSFDQLLECAESVSQTEDGFFLAVRPTVGVIPELHRLRDCEAVADLIIHSFDGTFWEITTTDDDLLTRLSAKFQDRESYPLMMEGGSDVPR